LRLNWRLGAHVPLLGGGGREKSPPPLPPPPWLICVVTGITELFVAVGQKAFLPPWYPCHRGRAKPIFRILMVTSGCLVASRVHRMPDGRAFRAKLSLTPHAPSNLPPTFTSKKASDPHINVAPVPPPSLCRRLPTVAPAVCGELLCCQSRVPSKRHRTCDALVTAVFM
jgi:hypothetical protein